jgi:hypothetical protein
LQLEDEAEICLMLYKNCHDASFCQLGNPFSNQTISKSLTQDQRQKSMDHLERPQMAEEKLDIDTETQ